MPVTVEQYADLSNLILSTAMEPDRWQQVVDRLGTIMGPQVCTQLMGYDLQTNAAPLAYASGYDPEILRLYEQHYSRINPYALNFDSMSVGKVVTVGELCRPETMKKTGFYADLLRPLEDIIYGGGTLLFRDENRMFLFGGNMRAKDHENHEQRWLALCARIAPAMRQSLEINRMISGLSFEKWVADQYRLGSQTALIVVDPKMRVRYASCEAEKLLERGDPVHTGVGGLLRFTLPAVQSDVEQLASLQTKGTRSVYRSWRETDLVGRNWICRAIGLRLDDMDKTPFDVFSGKPASALLLALKLETPHPETGKLVQTAFGLSQVETETALLLADGLTAKEIADLREVSIHTVRNQIKSVLSKSGSRRQADLVKAVERLRNVNPSQPHAPLIT